MKRQILIRYLSVGLLAGISMGLLTGCQDEGNIDYSIDGVTESAKRESNGGKSGVEQFKDEELWEAEWSVQSEESGWGPTMIDVIVDAKITVPRTEQMSVIEVVEPEFDATYKEQIAERVFENTDIYYGDIAHLPKQELEEMEEDFVVGSKMFIESPADEAKADKMMLDYKELLENANDTYTKVEQYTGNEYIGTYGDLSYELIFAEEEGDGVFVKRMKEIYFGVKDLHDVCPEAFKDVPAISCEPWQRGNMIENQCEISEEEALKEAQRFAEKLGLEYSVLSHPCPLVWGDATISNDETNDWVANGYVFSFDYGVDDISFMEFGREDEYNDFWTNTQNEKERQYSLEARMQIYVTDQGIIRMRAYNPIETLNISERVELLPLDTIKNIIEEQIETSYDEFRFSHMIAEIRFDRMDLIYFRVRDKENPRHYSYIPTWRLSNLTEDEELHLKSIVNPILINGIDGSVIDFYDET